MFSYRPLVDTLKKRGRTIGQLSEEVGMKENALILKVNSSENLTFEMLDRMCEYLDCQPSDVIEWKKGRVAEKVTMDWSKVLEKMKKESISFKDLAVYCHLDRTTLYKTRQRNSRVEWWVVKIIAKHLKCEPDELVGFAEKEE